jgi:site-specific DNA recombinase
MKAVAYYRFSSSNQHEESIEAQQEAVKNYANINEITIVKEYYDRAESATSDDRPQFQLMTNDITNGNFKVDCVLVHHTSRFARNRYDSIVYKHALSKSGVKVISVTQPTAEGPDGVFMEALYEAMDEHYSKRLSIEVKTKMRKYAEKAEHLGGIPPLGYNVVDIEGRKKYVINEKESEAIRIIYSKYLEGISKEKIAQHLNSLGYRTKINKSFTVPSLYEILKNEKYTGVYIFNRAIHKIGGKRNHRIANKPEDIIRIEDGMPQIINRETFEKVQAMLEKRKKAPGANGAIQLYLLTGLIYCGKCGGHMVGHRKVSGREKKIYYSYECSNRTRLKNCNAKAINKDYVENEVKQEMYAKVFSNPEELIDAIKMLHSQKIKNNESGLVIAEEQLKLIEDKLKGYFKAIEDGLYTSTMKATIKELERHKEEIAASIDEIKRRSELFIDEKTIKDFIDENYQMIFEGTPEKQKAIIASLVTKVTVYEESMDLNLIVDLNGGGGAYTLKSTIDISNIRGSIVYVNTGSDHSDKLIERRKKIK